MSLKHAIIGLLAECPMHGYALKRALSPALSRDRTVNDGILYPLLRRMEKEGLVRRKVERKKGTPDRHVYQPTAEGSRAFLEWLKGPTLEEDEVTYDFLLGHPFLTKCMFFGRLAPKEAAGKLRSQRLSARGKLDEFLAIRDSMRARGVDPWRIAILDLGIAQQEEKIAWLARMEKRKGARGSRRTIRPPLRRGEKP